MSGFDYFVARELGVSHPVEKVLLISVRCSGGLAAPRTSANLALGHTAEGSPAKVLCLALEISTMLVRSELDRMSENQETRIAVCLFSGCASAVVQVSVAIGERCEAAYDLLGWSHKIIPETEDDIRFDVDPLGGAQIKIGLYKGYKLISKPYKLEMFKDLLASLQLSSEYSYPSDFDWTMHPGGATILPGAGKAFGISSQHMRATYDSYFNHSNSSSATIFSDMDCLWSEEMDSMALEGGVRNYVVGPGFGSGITVEMCMLKRNHHLG
ncbi:Acylalkylpyrone synthase csyB [Cladobotryum mycophilum]|uniref:Acylalkylpyrone synthase csyB n=1 Tax=Cladobotryum mycophilum TaxID=491253 RepID=A0ABR0SSV3_9HYPO